MNGFKGLFYSRNLLSGIIYEHLDCFWLVKLVWLDDRDFFSNCANL